jgi:hypothetical protein
MITRLPLLFGFCFAIAIVLLIIFLANLNDSQKYRKKVILYFLAGGLLIGLASLIGFCKFEELPVWIFAGSYLWLIAAGILNVMLLEKAFPVENATTDKILLTMALFFLGNGLILLSFSMVIKSPFPWIYFFAGLCFLIPLFIAIAFDRFTDIPGKVFKEWSFPPPGSLSDPSDSEMAGPIIVNFVIRKGESEERTVFKAKAPKGLKLGRLFYYFVIDYNSRYPDHPIIIGEGENNLFKWSFSTTPSLLMGKMHLDPELTVAENRIKENSSVTCERLNFQI